MTCDRQNVFEQVKDFRYWLNDWLMEHRTEEAFGELGLDASLWVNKEAQVGPIEVHSARPARRIGPDGQQRTDLVVTITQGRPVYFNDAPDAETWEPLTLPDKWSAQDARQTADFWYRGGATLLIDLETGEPRYSLLKSIDPTKPRLRDQAEYEWRRRGSSLASTYFGGAGAAREPFAMLHRRDSTEHSHDQDEADKVPERTEKRRKKQQWREKQKRRR